MVLTNLKSFPSNFRALVNTTVLAGMLRPRANVSVANKAWQKKKTNNLFVNKKPEIIMSWLVHRLTTTENVVFLALEMERCRTVRICVQTTNQQQFSIRSLRWSFLHLHFISAVHIWFISHIINTHFFHGNIRTHHWPAPNVSGFIAQLVEHHR